MMYFIGHIKLYFIFPLRIFHSNRVQMLPQTVIYYTAYDQLKMRIGFKEGQQNFVAPLVSGVTSRCKSIL